MTLPATGRPAADVLADLRTRHTRDLPTHGGRVFAYTYDSGRDDLTDLLGQALTMYAAVNGLDPTVFPSIVALENDVVGAAAALLGGGPDGVASVVGTLTSGGTESCILAVKAAREWAARRGARDAAPGAEASPGARPSAAGEAPGARASAAGEAPGSRASAAGRAVPPGARPTMVVADTVHPAFRKGGHLLGVDVITVPADPRTFRADPAAMAAAIDERTILVVASAPSYAHGVIDPVAEIAAAAAERGVPCHVDSCIGGWLLPYYRRLGRAVPAFGFDVPGVTSISVDLHKYAYASKGASVLLCRDAGYRRGTYYASADWPGYPFINTTLQSTKSAGPLAAAWAGLQHVGDDGFLRLAADTAAATDALAAGIAAVPGLRVLGAPDAALIAFAADGHAEADAETGLDIYVVADELRLRGWYVQPQPRTASSPANIHLTVTAASLPRVEPLLADLAGAVVAARAHGPATPPPELLTLAETLDPATLTPAEVAGLLAASGFDPGSAADARMATVSHLLDALSPRAREELLKEFIGFLYQPPAQR